nr:response regulator [Gehongia tenuis]
MGAGRYWRRSYFAERGFGTAACESGGAALALLAQKSFVCMVLDVMMPGMDGYAVCRTVRKKAGTPVIFLSRLDHSMIRSRDGCRAVFQLCLSGRRRGVPDVCLGV